MQVQATYPAVCPAAMTTEQRVGEYLKRFGDAVTPIGSGRWRINHDGDGQTHIEVVVDEGWLVVEQALSDCRLARDGDVQEWSWRLLGASLERPSGARPVLAEQDDPPWPRTGSDRARPRPANNLSRMRAERFVASRPADSRDDDLCRWIALACADVAAVSAGALPAAIVNALPAAMVDEAHTGPGCDEAIHPDIPALHKLADCSNIPALCELAGWSTSSRRTSNDTLVPLPARNGGAGHAIATMTGTAVQFRTALELTPTNEMTPACLAAVAVALLRIAGSVRLVRATLARVDGGVAAALDVRAQLPLGPESIDQALSCLALARQQVAAEIDALAGDEVLASAYLAFQESR